MAYREIRIACFPGGPVRVLRAPMEDDMKPDPKRPTGMPGTSEGMVLVHGVSRAQARAKGELVPVNEAAARAGFEAPTDLTGHLHDALTRDGLDPERMDALLATAFSCATAAGKRDRFDFHFDRMNLVAILAAGDEGKPEVTIGFAEDF